MLAKIAIDASSAHAAVGRIRSGRDKFEIPARGPNTRLDNRDIQKSIASDIAAEASGDRGIRLEAEDFSGGAHATSCEQREQSDIGAEVVEDIAGTELFSYGRLHRALDISMQIILSRAGVELEPQARGRASFHTRPCDLTGGQKAMAQAVNEIPENGDVAQ